MKDRMILTMKDAAKYSLAVLCILGILQPFNIDELKGYRLPFILAGAMIVFVSTIISTVAAMPVKSQKGRLVASYIMNIPIVSAGFVYLNSVMHTGSLAAYWRTPGAFLQLLVWVALVSIIIAIWDIYRRRNDKLEKELEEVRNINALLEERQTEMEQSAPSEDVSETATSVNNTKCELKSTVGSTSLEVSPKDIIYIESMSNYADVNYIDNGETRHKTLRITMKQLREELAGYPFLVSCHRAFIININFALALTTRTPGNYQIQLFGMERQIPVSRTNVEAIRLAVKK